KPCLLLVRAGCAGSGQTEVHVLGNTGNLEAIHINGSRTRPRCRVNKSCGELVLVERRAAGRHGADISERLDALQADKLTAAGDTDTRCAKGAVEAANGRRTHIDERGASCRGVA